MKAKILKPAIDFLCDEEATTAVEYAVMAALIAAACMGSVIVLAGAVSQNFDSSSAGLGN